MAAELEMPAEQRRLARDVARILDECRLSHAVHPRKLKEISALRSSSSPMPFFSAFARALTPLFDFPRRTPAAERAARFAAAFAARRDERYPDASDAFVEQFLRFLLVAANAAHRPARFRACQIISEIIMRLPDDAEVSDEVWDEVIEIMKERVEDKVPTIRAFAVRALSRFANVEENGDILELFLQTLPQEPNVEVRKTIVLSLPPSDATASTILDSTLDVSESVRKAAYCVLASKFPLQSLSIKLRTVILQRGLSDRSPSVTKECLKMLKDEWLTKCCGGDPVALLRFLDVETYESVGEVVMDALLRDGMVQVQEGPSLRQFLTSCNKGEECGNFGVHLMEAEIALYWKTLCRHLQTEAQAKGSDAATTTGTEAAVYASEASASNDLLDGILPVTASDYIRLVKAHLLAGPNFRFASRQLLLLGAMLDFSDATNRKVASTFVQELLLRPLEFELDDEGNKLVIGDGVSLGGDQEWAKAVSELARKVHASAGEFEEIVTQAIEELARPCRERTADFMQWIHCLALTGLLLENIDSLWSFQRKAIEPSELLHSLLLPGAKQSHVDVQRVATRCLCLFGLLEKKPSEELVKQLRLSFINGPSSVSVMAGKALIDLATWHGLEEVDKAIGLDEQQSNDEKDGFSPVDLSNLNEDVRVRLLELLYSGLDRVDWGARIELDDHDTIHSILAEGFAKFLLLSENYPSISTSLHPLILKKLITLYFSEETKELQRVKQCLSVFFEHYPALSCNHKKCVSRAFIPVMRSMWPGIYGSPGGASVVVSRMRKRAVQASRFMLQMIQAPLFSQEDEEAHSSENSESFSCTQQASPDLESGEEGLAIRIASEVTICPEKKTPAGKSYILALCRVVVSLQFRPTEQEAIKCMRGLLGSMITSASAEKDLVKELNLMAGRLRSLDESPDEELSQERANAIFGKLEIEGSLEIKMSAALPPTPAPRSTKTASTRRRVRRAASPDEVSSPALPITPVVANIRSQRASKAAAMSKMSAQNVVAFTDSEDEDDSDVTSEED